MDLVPVGVVRAPFATPLDAPRQGHLTEVESVVEVFPEFAPALGDLGPPARVLVVTWAHLADRAHLQRPDGTGAFQTRMPHRPNPILVTEAAVVGRDGARLTVRGLDAVDGTPVLDLKPAESEIEGPAPFLARAAAEWRLE